MLSLRFPHTAAGFQRRNVKNYDTEYLGLGAPSLRLMTKSAGGPFTLRGFQRRTPAQPSRWAVSEIGSIRNAGLSYSSLLHFRFPQWCGLRDVSNSRTRCRLIAFIRPMRAEVIWPLFSAASVTMRAAAWTFGIVCSDFGMSLASHAIVSLSVRSFRPSGSSIGSSNFRCALLYLLDKNRGRSFASYLFLFYLWIVDQRPTLRDHPIEDLYFRQRPL